MIDGYVITFGENGNRLPDVCFPTSVVLLASQDGLTINCNVNCRQWLLNTNWKIGSSPLMIAIRWMDREY
jgi:hypothetical protein